METTTLQRLKVAGWKYGRNDIYTTAYPVGMCDRNELFLVITITNEFYCFTNGCCLQCVVGVEDMLDCLIGECKMFKEIE